MLQRNNAGSSSRIPAAEYRNLRIIGSSIPSRESKMAIVFQSLSGRQLFHNGITEGLSVIRELTGILTPSLYKTKYSGAQSVRAK